MNTNSLDQIIISAVERSKNIEDIVVGNGVIVETPKVYRQHFGSVEAILIADENTWRVAGAELREQFQKAGIAISQHILSGFPCPKPTTILGDKLSQFIREKQGIPISVGSGVINDLVKYASFQAGQPYCCFATAASMDGYASSGSSMIHQGFKKTISGDAPKVILGDLDIISTAPPKMSGWGYGDLSGKVPAGGDWILADALGIEPIDDLAWPLVQNHLSKCLENPQKIAGGDSKALARLFYGLSLTGLAMEFHGSSRPASGADHQIAHLWEMEDLQHQGVKVSHGACVSIGCLSVLSLYDWLLKQDLSSLNIEQAISKQISLGKKEELIQEFFPQQQIAEKAMQETKIKHIEKEALTQRLEHLKMQWPSVEKRLRKQLMTMEEMQRLLKQAGAPYTSLDIGINHRKLRQSILSSRFLRSRYTVLDLLEETGFLESAVTFAKMP